MNSRLLEFHLSFLVMTFISLATAGVPAVAMEFGFGVHQTVFPLPSANSDALPLSQGNSCQQVFSRPNQSFLFHFSAGKKTISMEDALSGNINPVGLIEPEFITTQTGRPAALHQKLFEEAMEQWGVHSYSPRQIQLLREVNDQLPPNRVHWFQFRFDQSQMGANSIDLPPELIGVSSMRIFDGSTPMPKILGMRTATDLAPSEGGMAVRDPIELSPKNQAAGYRLPWNREGEAHYWHLGIGTNQKGFEAGLNAMFSEVAQNLDNHYNNAHYKTFQATDAVDAVGMKIISSAKPELVDFYRQFGFKVLDPETGEPATSVFRVHRNGQAEKTEALPQLPDGMILIGQSGGEFLQRFYGGDMMPNLSHSSPFGSGTASFRLRDTPKSEKKDKPAEEVFLEGNQRAFQRLETYNTQQDYLTRVSQVETLHREYALAIMHFVNMRPHAQKMTQPEQVTFKGDKAWKDLVIQYRRFVINLYALVKNTPERWRTSEWDEIEMAATSLLGDYPLEAWNSPALKANSQQTRLEILDFLYQFD